MATIEIKVDGFRYTGSEKHGGESFDVPVDLDRLSEDVRKQAAVKGIMTFANQHTAATKDMKSNPKAGIETWKAMIEYMLSNDTLDKPESEKKPKAHIDQKLITALLNAGVGCETRADAEATYEAAITAEGFTTKADVEKRKAQLFEAHESIKNAYDALEEATGKAVKL